MNKNYSVTFADAKQMKEYKFTKPTEDKMQHYREIFKCSSDEDYYDAALEVLEFGNIDIELNVTYSNSKEKKNLLDFFICYKCKNNEWESHGFSNYKLKEEDLSSSEMLESVMFREMIKYAQKHNLHWNKNDY